MTDRVCPPAPPAAAAESPAGPRPRRRSLLTLGSAATAVLIAGVLSLMPGILGSAEPAGSGRVRAIAAPATLDSRSADRVARRVSAARADVTAVWRHDFRWRLGRTYTPPEVVHFTGSRPSPCGGVAGVSGLAYCPLDRTVSLDLAVLGDLAGQLHGEGDRALVLLVARATATHVQGELAILGDADRARHALSAEGAAALDEEIALQGDCLTGVWARRAARRVGELPPGSWAGLVAAVREASAGAAAASGLAAAEPEAREGAFARGYAAGDLRDCLAPGLAGVLG